MKEMPKHSGSFFGASAGFPFVSARKELRRLHAMSEEDEYALIKKISKTSL
jgi:hypothetical protein